ncbi:helix-turn-helix transcriptional regulator [uncultured Acetatifactor sp.]|jgi:transcriptional regulator with XRE-family HTH domain|uniref:helix-turn-helix domain-containing protein n=1 Tax=uncultured Acetatifactor sp. TaxID=1671927 RepID=UPI00260358D7|nr:helix-turn-helix transcriptional regulator [uncultured Acetatifactor sp.]MCI8696539.1 helix-turn-helix transcriptional regulator [Lachnospiraceae bacterium]
MTKYVENINSYLSHRKIKQTYISLKTGIDAKKLSRILTGAQDIGATDMEKIAGALGKKAEFFLSDSFRMEPMPDLEPEKVFFYAQKPTPEQERIAEKMLKLLENIDEVMSARIRFLNIAKGAMDEH